MPHHTTEKSRASGQVCWIESSPLFCDAASAGKAMATKPNTKRNQLVRPRLRVQCGEDIALGPGKLDLLALIAETGSTRDAAERMNMSYMRAWTLIRTMNRCCKAPLVEAVRGGKERGGARLTCKSSVTASRVVRSNSGKLAWPSLFGSTLSERAHDPMK